MRARVLLAGVALLVAATPMARGAAVPAESEPLPALHADTGDGARIADAHGRTVLLRGVNVNGLGEYYQEWPDLPATLSLTEADFADMAAMGFDVVRLLITWSSIEPVPGTIDAGYLARVEEAVGWAAAHDIYVVLDMHQDAWGPHVDTPDGVTCPPGTVAAIGWDGAPEWATALVGTVATCRLEIGREFSIAVQTSFEQLYTDVGGVQSHLVDSWAAVAARFASDPAVAGYDLLNEPNPGLTIGVDDLALLGAFYGRAIAAMRDAEAAASGGFDHIAFFEPAVLFGPLPVSGPLPGFTTDDNLVYAPHLYNESISPLPGTIEDGFANAATAASLHGTTFWSGEWGWFGDPATDQAALERYAAAEDAALVGGTWWQWKQACGDPHAVGVRGHRPGCAESSIYSDGLVTRSRDNTMVLDRAYPRAAPGALTRVSSEIASGALVVEGIADRAGVAADLWVPARCAAPAVTPAASLRSVTGGWRVEVPIAEPGPYRIEVRCGAPTAGPSTPGGVEPDAATRLPATGGAGAMGVAACIVLVALLIRGGLRAAAR